MRVVAKLGLAIVAGSVVALSQLPRSVAQQSPGPSSFPALVRSEPLEVQQQKITSLAEAGMVFGEETLPEAFDLLISGKALNTYMDAFDEPLSESRLDALDRLLLTNKDPDAKFRAAVLLYRHGRQAGTEFLRGMLEKHDLRAAHTFALNREQEMVPLVAETILTTRGRADELLMSVTLMLTDDQAQRLLAAIEDRDWDTPRAVALPLLARAGKLEALRVEFAKYAEDDSVKLEYAAALSRMGDDDAISFLQAQLRRVSTQQQPAKRSLLFRAVGLSAKEVFVEELQQILIRSATSVAGIDHQELRKRQDNIIGALVTLRVLGAPQND